MELNVDQELLGAVLAGTGVGLEMTAIPVRPVGATTLFTTRHPFAVIVSLVGKNSGTVTINVSERALLLFASQLMGEEYAALSEDVFDAMMEIGNIIGSNVKDMLQKAGYAVDSISVPALVVGASYDMHYSRGMNTVSVDFEIQNLPFGHLPDRIFSTTVCLIGHAKCKPAAA